ETARVPGDDGRGIESRHRVEGPLVRAAQARPGVDGGSDDPPPCPITRARSSRTSSFSRSNSSALGTAGEPDARRRSAKPDAARFTRSPALRAALENSDA